VVLEINGMQSRKEIMDDISVIILTHNEEIHIERCLRSLLPIASKIYIVDSYSTDRTREIAESFGVEVVQHGFVNHSNQFNWALDSLSIETEWIMRVDADEYLEPSLQQELHEFFLCLSSDVDGVYLKRKVFFLGKWIRYGGFYPHILLRIWRKGKGRVEQRWMDEHIVLPAGSQTVMAKGHLVDYNRKGIGFWIEKHNKYASREAVDLLSMKYPILKQDESLKQFNDPQARKKRILKEKVYARLPVGLRPVLYFFFRYFLRFGFLDGSKGFMWHFLQGFWYRLLVDIKVMEIEERSRGDVNKMKDVLLKDYGIKL
jgi:glycosyltransferase involved in cell wall biosynthesis